LRALISVSDKQGIVEFSKGLVALGYVLISTGGTYDALKRANIPVSQVQDSTQFPEMMDGRVKTLHPKIHGGILGLRKEASHQTAAQEHGIEWIDLVVVNLYPFEATIAKPDVVLEDAIENIDIGGPSMIRSAAKNHHDVAVVVDPSNYEALLLEMQANHGVLTLKTKQKLAVQAFSHTAKYDAVISKFLGEQYDQPVFPEVVTPVLTKVSDLRYGENPHQQAAFYRLAGEKGMSWVQYQGKSLSYNNLLDTEAAWQIAKGFSSTAAVIIKHNTPCGVAIAETLVDAYTKALASDPVSAFGGIVGFNRDVDAATAIALKETFLEVIIAPGYCVEALEILSEKTNLRVLSMEDFNAPAATYNFRHLQGGFLLQTPDVAPISSDTWRCVTTIAPDVEMLREMGFAFEVVRAMKSNAIVVTKNGATLGMGAGQVSRIDAVEMALTKSGDAVKGAVLASDAFFPFSDSVEMAYKAGVLAIVQPGGSKRDQESIDFCNANGMVMMMTDCRHFKH